MITLHSLDPAVPLDAQLRNGAGGPIVLVSLFAVPQEAIESFLDLWRADAAFMADQPGFRATRVARGTADSQLLCSIAEWDSTEALAAAVTAAGTDPAAQERSRSLMDPVAAYIHIFEQAPIAEVRANLAPTALGDRPGLPVA